MAQISSGGENKNSLLNPCFRGQTKIPYFILASGESNKIPLLIPGFRGLNKNPLLNPGFRVVKLKSPT